MVGAVAYALLAVPLAFLVLTKRFFSPLPVVIALQVAGMLVVVWARLTFGMRSFHVRSTATQGGLVTTGPYRFVRHPIYAGVLVILAGVLVGHHDIATLIPVACVALELDIEARKLRGEIDNLVSALAGVNDKPAPIVHAIAERNERLSSIEHRLHAARTAPEAIEREVRLMVDEAKKRLNDLHKAFDRNPEEARFLLNLVLDGPITFTPTNQAEGPRYRLSAKASRRKILAAMMGETVSNQASPAGVEPALAT